jgi:hypothetical protein
MTSARFEVDYPDQPRRTITVTFDDNNGGAIPAVFRALHELGYDPNRVTACYRLHDRKNR